MCRFGLVGLLLTLTACSKNPADERVDGWALTRAALTNGSECFAGRAEYCITDPDFVDAAIKPRLDDLYGGEMPQKRLKVDGTIRAVRRQYRRELMKPENVARVEELVKERYQNPKLSVDGHEASLDMGVVPGPLEPVPATLGLRMTTSEMVDDGVWVESEAKRVLGDLATRYPNLATLRAIVTVVTGHGLTALTYRYLRAERRVVVTSEDGQAWSTRRFDGDADGLEKVSLKREDLSTCRIASGPPRGDDDRRASHAVLALDECPPLAAD